MSFPERNWFGMPKGWQDRGEVEKFYLSEGWSQVGTCPSCHSRAKVGRQNNEPFLFCPKCLVKLKEKE